MKRISFNQRFINETGNDLLPGKIHTIRSNVDFWKRYEGQEVALFTWEGKPYRSKQKVFCVKRIVSVQEVYQACAIFTLKETPFINGRRESIPSEKILKNDGFEKWSDFHKWFYPYPSGKMGILHFTRFKY